MRALLVALAAALALAAPAAATDLRWHWTREHTASVLAVQLGGWWRCRGLNVPLRQAGERFYSELRCRPTFGRRVFVYPVGYQDCLITRHRIGPDAHS